MQQLSQQVAPQQLLVEGIITRLLHLQHGNYDVACGMMPCTTLATLQTVCCLPLLCTAVAQHCTELVSKQSGQLHAATAPAAL
jgi:hypothetical protein